MTIIYTLNENDFLQYQLYIASKTDSIKKQRKNTWLIFSGSFLLLSFMFYQSGNTFLTYYFLFFGIIVACFYPTFQKWYHRNHYRKYIVENYKNKLGDTGRITFKDDIIEIVERAGEFKIKLTEIENTTEIADYFFIKMNSGGHLILPKNQLDNIDNVRNGFKQICNKLSVSFIEELNWRWK